MMNPAEPIEVRNGVCILWGYGIRVSVLYGQLYLEDGVGTTRRQTRFARGSCPIRRLVIISRDGMITLEALKWLRDIRAAIMILEPDGQPLFFSGPSGPDNPHLRRNQVLAREGMTGKMIIQRLIREKIRGQMTNLMIMGFPEAAESIREILDSIPSLSDSLEPVLEAEASAARIYWDAWKDVPVRFARSDDGRVPLEWKKFGSRYSKRSRSPRAAITPGNAMLNFLYTILYMETSILLRAYGFDPGLGWLHSDQANRESLSCDVMEAVRPAVDIWLYRFLTEHFFRKSDFVEMPFGTVRLAPELRNRLVETIPLWSRAVLPYVEEIARLLDRRFASRRDRSQIAPKADPNDLRFPSCAECGFWLEPGGFCPQHGRQGFHERGEINRRRARERREFLNPEISAEDFQTKILPRLREIPLRRLARETGLSISYCSMIRRGLVLPSPPVLQRICNLFIKEHSDIS